MPEIIMPAPLVPTAFAEKRAALDAEMAALNEPFPLPPDVPTPHVTVPQGMSDAEAVRMSQPDKNTDRTEQVQGIQSNNPKDIAAQGKCPLWLIPPEAMRQEARVLEHGASKYSEWNWRGERIRLSNYLSATMRHLAAFIDGEDADPESGLSHLAHARATLGIILDAQKFGLIDDRPRDVPETDFGNIR